MPARPGEEVVTFISYREWGGPNSFRKRSRKKDGQRVALIADLQIWGNEETDRRIVDRIIKEKPALVLIAGEPTDEDERSESEREDTHAFSRRGCGSASD